MKSIPLVIFYSLLIVHCPSRAQDNKPDESKSKDPFSSETFKGLKFRSIGPALTSGRVVDVAVNPKDRSQYYVAVASG